MLVQIGNVGCFFFLIDELSTDLSCRRLVPTSVWNKLKVYFPSAPQFPKDSKICKYCLVSYK